MKAGFSGPDVPRDRDPVPAYGPDDPKVYTTIALDLRKVAAFGKVDINVVCDPKDGKPESLRLVFEQKVGAKPIFDLKMADGINLEDATLEGIRQRIERTVLLAMLS